MNTPDWVKIIQKSLGLSKYTSPYECWLHYRLAQTGVCMPDYATSQMWAAQGEYSPFDTPPSRNAINDVLWACRDSLHIDLSHWGSPDGGILDMLNFSAWQTKKWYIRARDDKTWLTLGLNTRQIHIINPAEEVRIEFLPITSLRPLHIPTWTKASADTKLLFQFWMQVPEQHLAVVNSWTYDAWQAGVNEIKAAIADPNVNVGLQLSLYYEDSISSHKNYQFSQDIAPNRLLEEFASLGRELNIPAEMIAAKTSNLNVNLS